MSRESLSETRSGGQAWKYVLAFAVGMLFWFCLLGGAQ